MKKEKQIQYFIIETTHRSVSKSTYLKSVKAERVKEYISRVDVSTKKIFSRKELNEFMGKGHLKGQTFAKKIFFRRDDIKTLINERSQAIYVKQKSLFV